MWKTIYNSMKTTYVPDKEISKISPFMFLRWLGNNRVTVIAANQFNRYYKEIPILNTYKTIQSIYGGKKIYIEMPKFKETYEEYLDAICWHFQVNKNVAPEYAQFLSKEELQEINELYEEKQMYEKSTKKED